MKWQGRKKSSNMDDRRNSSSRSSSRNSFRRSSRTGSRLRLPTGGGRSVGGGGIGIIVIVVVVGMFLGVNPLELLSGNVPSNTQTQTSTQSPASTAADDELFEFMAVVAQDTEELWGQVFAQNDLNYAPPTIVVYEQRTSAGCGVANASMGPFYCPADQNVYLDLSFYAQLREQFGAPGDFAQAYVLAHEVGHHVQQLTGVLPEFNRVRNTMSREEANAYSVRIELQADCYAGIWANYASQENLLESGDIEEALNAAVQIGDDTLQERMQGYSVPKTFSHGTSAQRKRWFGIGLKSGDVGQCDTFDTNSL